MNFVVLFVNFIGRFELGHSRVVMERGRAIGPTRGILIEAEDEKFAIIFQYLPKHDGITFLLPLGHLYICKEVPLFMKSWV
jgi:hypothetical protein